MKNTLFKYVFKMQLHAILFLSLSVFFLVLLFDFAEITRKFPISNVHETIFAMKLSILRAPSTFCEILHYIYFMAATFSLWNLCKSHQMTIIKSVGHSPQQILYPFVSCAFLIAAMWLFIVHPTGLFCEESYYNAILGTPINSPKANKNVWVDLPKNDQIIFIKNIKENEMEDLYVFDTKNNDRTFAKHAVMKDNHWFLENVITINDGEIKHTDQADLTNHLSIDLTKLLLKAPSKQDIYYLYKIYKIQKEDKVTLKLYELELHKLLSNCANFILFALIAAIICFPINRYKTKTNIVIKAILTSIFLRFINNILETLVYSGVISLQFACWSVVSILICISIAILIWKEA
jgi:lipopolysaccharide export LptBFGC system permease protein LptF